MVKNSTKTPFKNIFKKRSPKTMNFDAQRVPKGSQNQYKNVANIDATNACAKGKENHGNSYVFDM